MTFTLSVLLLAHVVASVPQQPPPSQVTSAAPALQPPESVRVGLALVIGNSRYAQAELPTVATDQQTMAKALESLGFKVREAPNLTRPRDFEETLRTFLADADATPEDTLLVYYSGHGLQIDGRPHLLGTGVTATGDVTASLREFSIDVETIIRIMEQAAPTARVLIVDACRNNAFATSAKKAGFAFQQGIEDTYILFADEPGKTVPARNEATMQSPFTAGLLYAFETSDSGLERRFEIAREKTRELSPDQMPQIYKSEASASRDRSFLDHGGRSAPTRSAGNMLNEAEALYQARSWPEFRSKIAAARVLSSEPELTARLEREMTFSDLMLQAVAAEGGGQWGDAAAAYEQAGALFPRPWVHERAAVGWLLADRPEQAITVLTGLQAQLGKLPSERDRRLLDSLVTAYPSLAPPAPVAPAGAVYAKAEFERYVAKQ